MLSAHPFYQELACLVKDCLPSLPPRARKRLVWFVVGILLAQSIVLRKIAVAQASCGGGSLLVASHERHLRRIVNDARLSWVASYAPAVRRLLRWKPDQPLYLLVDESGHTDQVRLLMVALWYRGRAVPLTWVQRSIPLDGAPSYWDLVQQLLAQLHELLPSDLQVLLIADRAFGNPAFTDLVQAFGWHWLVRLQGQTCFRDCQGRRSTVRRMLARPGCRWKGQGWLFRKAGWRAASVVAFWDRVHREPLLLASNLSLKWELLRLYKYRGAIECLFRDWKSQGWQWEASQVRELAHRERLYVGMAWATLVTLCVGQQVATEILAHPSPRRQTRPEAAKCGLFTLGRERLMALWMQTVAQMPAWHLDLQVQTSWSESLMQQRAFRALDP